MKKYTRYSVHLLISALFYVLIFVAFNLLIDPYGVIRSPTFTFLNLEKPAQDNHIRLFKAIDVIHQKPKTILLGSSRMNLGLNAANLQEFTPTPVYNLALNGATMHELRCYLEHAIANQPNVKQVFLGLDFFMFNKNFTPSGNFSKKRLQKKSIILSDLLDSTFSLTAVVDSVKTLSSNYNNKSYPSYLSNGSRNEEYLENWSFYQDKIRNFKRSLTKYLSSPRHYVNYQLSPTQLQELITIIQLCQTHQIQLTTFISPSHASQWEAVDMMQLWDTFEQWKATLVKLTPTWDFSGYNSITTEPLEKKMKYYWDNSHYRQNVGKLIIDRMIGRNKKLVPDDFGVLLTPDNLEAHLALIRQQQKQWRGTNPEVLKLLSQIKQEIAQ